MTTQADFAEMLEKSEERNLKLKTKIIELENELNHEKIRAREYEIKFKDAVLQSEFAEAQELLQKLSVKQKQLLDCRKQVLQLNRRLANTSHAPTQTDLIALARENEQLMDSIEQIKSAAINAIMMKEQEIEQLNKEISKYSYMEGELKLQYQKYENLQREYEQALIEKEAEAKELNEKIVREREDFLSKLENIQKEANQEETTKLKLLEKAHYLEGTVEKSQIIIEQYQTKILELESQLSQQKLLFDKQKTKLELQIEGEKEDCKMYEKDQKTLAKMVEQLKAKEREARQSVKRLTKTNEDLTYKLSLKKKRENKALKQKITSSFAGVVKQNPVYASFAFLQKDSIIDEEEEVNPKHLGDYPEIQEIDGLIENFDFQELGRKKSDDFKEVPKDDVKDIPFSQIMTKKKTAEPSDLSKQEETISTQATQSAAATPQMLKQIESLKQTILRLQTEKKELQSTLNDSYNQVQQLNQTINNLTLELQSQRKSIAELRHQLKKTKKQSQLIVQMQSLTLHVQKLQMDMVASKLKYAEEVEFVREKYNREKIIWTQKLVQLTERIAQQDMLIQSKGEQKKKKRGFFG